MLDRRLEKMLTVVQENMAQTKYEIDSTEISSANFLQLRSGKILGSRFTHRMFPDFLLI